MASLASCLFINSLRLDVQWMLCERQMSVTTRRTRGEPQNWHDITRCRVQFNLSPRAGRGRRRAAWELKQVVPTHATNGT